VNISIRDITAKPEWLAKVAAVLHDATVGDPATYDSATQTFRLPLSRIGYEFRVRSPGFFTTSRMPYVPAVLGVAPVVLLTPEEAPDSRREGDQLIDIGISAPGELHFTTREGVIAVRCVGAATLSLCDSGPPEARFAVTDFGALVIPPALITELVNTSVA
jgi:hypothetical protein